MSKPIQTEVLVVGAGPVGLVTANLLADRGVRVAVIDKEQNATTRSYACALHPHSLELLERMGLLEEVLKLGYRINMVAFYDRKSRRAEAKLTDLSARHPFVVVLPQFAFEGLLARRLASTGRGVIHWSHRLKDLRTGNDAVAATVEKLGETSMGYGVSGWGWCVEGTVEFSAAFVAGADGRHSMVRRMLGIQDEVFGSVESFAVYEFELEGDAGREVQVVLDKTSDVLWPLAKTRSRWSFGREKPVAAREFPSKERSPWRVLDPESDAATREDLEHLIRERAPWFKPRVSEVEWTTDVHFEHCLARELGRGRCWLVGDAAHQTGPAGMQSMNFGLTEADELGGKLAEVLQKGASLSLLDSYPGNHRAGWQQMLGGNWLRAREKTDPWIREQAARILPCIPAAGSELKYMLGQLGLDVP